MPPRIPLFPCLRTAEAAKLSPSSIRPFTSTTTPRASTGTQRRRHQDPYAIAQAKARKAANITRQEVLKKERAAALGDPVRGETTPYVRSFDTARLERTAAPTHDADPSQPHDMDSEERLSYFLSKPELEAGLRYSQWLSTPSPTPDEPSFAAEYADERTPEERAETLQKQQATAEEAVRRITNLSIGSAQERMRVNIQRCIADFGRHKTDAILPSRPLSTMPIPPDQLPKTPRVGPDTGSSEVQIAILTAKIRALADFLETRGKTDRSSKRDLRLLVHRRAKLLKYLRRKERGGPRFQNVVDTLGLMDATWKGEITIMGPLGGHSEVRLARLQKAAAKG